MRSEPTGWARRLRPAGRETLAVLVAGVLAAVTWLYLVQQSMKHGFTRQNFDVGLGRLFGGGPGGDEKRKGLQVTLAMGVGVAVLFALVRRPLRLGWLWRGVIFAVAAYLAWALVFCTRVDDHGIPGGAFGTDAGRWTPLVGAVCMLAAGVVLARVHEMTRSAAWWEPKHVDLHESIREIFQQGRPDGPTDRTDAG